MFLNNSLINGNYIFLNLVELSKNMKRIKEFLIRKFDVNLESIDIANKSFSSIFVKVIGMLSALGVSIFIGRLLGIEGYGTIELSNRIATVFLMLSLFGLPDVLLKKIAIANLKKKYNLIKNYMYTAISFSGVLALINAIIILILAPFLVEKVFGVPKLLEPLRIMIIAMILHALTRCFTSGINGLGKIWQSSFGDQTLSMIFILVLLLVINQYVSIDIKIVAYIYLISRIGVAIVMGWYWFKLLPVSQSETPRVFQNQLLKPASHLLVSSASSLIAMSASSIILGVIATVREVGLYNISARLALLTIIFMQITNSALAPKIASFYHLNKKNELQKLLSSITFVLVLVGLTSLMIYIYGGRYILSLWGDDFKDAYYYLILLSIGQFVNVATGAVSTILVMTDNEKIVGRISFIFMILSIVLNVIFIKYFGGIGAALATSIIIAGENITRLIYVKSKTGINMLAFLNVKIN